MEDDSAATVGLPWTLRELAVAHSLGKYVCTYYEYTSTRAHTHTHTHAHTHTYSVTHTPQHTAAHINTQTQTHTHTHIHSHAHTFTHTQTHTCTHQHTHTHTHSHTHLQRDLPRGNLLVREQTQQCPHSQQTLELTGAKPERSCTLQVRLRRKPKQTGQAL